MFLTVSGNPGDFRKEEKTKSYEYVASKNESGRTAEKGV
jgi:hypothetical protein